METEAATSSPHPACAHCGLPITSLDTKQTEVLYCCRACRTVALILGKGQGEHNWNLLRLGLGTLFAMNIMMISLLLYSGSIETSSIPIFRLALLGLAAPALAILLPPFLAGAWRECSDKKISIDALIACGSLAAFSVSAVNAWRGAGPVYFDTATMLPVLVTFGKIIEASAKTRAADLLHSLEALLPATAQRVTCAGTAEVAIGTLKVGDLIRVRPGERIAVDGIVREGISSIEEAAFTGEFLPRTCRPGDSVIAGTVNGEGSLLIEANRTGSQLLLHGIISMIQDAWRNPADSERIAQRAAALFIPVLLILAVCCVICWSISGNLEQGLLSALSVLVVACPCTIGIATPLATSLAVARAARAGIIVRGGSAMERIAKIDTVYFDKTGTLTVGRPVLQGIQDLDVNTGERELLGRLAALESAGGHLLGRAVAEEAVGHGCGSGSVSRVEVHHGGGMSGAVTWQGVTKQVFAGSQAFVRTAIGERVGAATCALDRAADVEYCKTAWGTEDGSLLSDTADGICSVVEVAWDGILRGRLLFADAIRSDARCCIESVEGLGISCVLLSGDRLSAATYLARQVGIAQVRAPRTPAEKLQDISDHMGCGHIVAMIGDGINDAPALAAAHAGVAFGAGTELARQAGNVVILSDRLGQLPWLIELSRQTCSIIRGNFACSFGYNAIALGAAMAGLLHPLLAALAMVVSSLTVLGNSLRISGFPDDAVLPSDGALPDSQKLAMPQITSASEPRVTDSDGGKVDSAGGLVA
jgi:P-type Cu2+ transporter